jgi:gas vesicle protein
MAKNGNAAKKIAVGAAIAAPAGYVVGMLTAPKSGKEARKDIQDTAAKGVAEAEKQLSKVQDELKGLLDDATNRGEKLSKKAKEEFDDALGKADTAKGKTRDVLTALRKGTADDKELQRALNDAKDAIKHLRKYLSK